MLKFGKTLIYCFNTKCMPTSCCAATAHYKEECYEIHTEILNRHLRLIPGNLVDVVIKDSRSPKWEYYPSPNRNRNYPPPDCTAIEIPLSLIHI